MSRVATPLWLGAGALSVIALVPAGLEPVLVGTGGLGLLALGYRARREPRVTLGAVVLLGAVLYAAVLGLADGLVIVGTLGTVLAWDATENAVGLHHQLGAAAETTRAELAHVGATLAAGGAIGGLALLTAAVARDRLPALAAIVIVAGAILLLVAVTPFGEPTADA